jgi:hypothetical protein
MRAGSLMTHYVPICLNLKQTQAAIELIDLAVEEVTIRGTRPEGAVLGSFDRVSEMLTEILKVRNFYVDQLNKETKEKADYTNDVLTAEAKRHFRQAEKVFSQNQIAQKLGEISKIHNLMKICRRIEPNPNPDVMNWDYSCAQYKMMETLILDRQRRKKAEGDAATDITHHLKCLEFSWEKYLLSENNPLPENQLTSRKKLMKYDRDTGKVHIVDNPKYVEPNTEAKQDN